MTQRVLVIDDEPDIRELLELTLLRMGLETATAGTVKDGLLEIQNFQPDLCLTDMKLPDGTGFDIVRYIQREHSHVPVAVITAFGSMEGAVEALKAGAYDFVSKPVDLAKLRDLVQTALKLSQKGGPDASSGNAEYDAGSNPIIGESPAIELLKKTIAKLARSQAPVFIHGASGTGKELVAKQIHLQSPRSSGAFVPVNCGAIPESLMESEFFGHKKGSFTGAVEDKAGLFQAAHHGTLFLDEVADLPLSMQVKLLRAIQEKAVKSVGGVEEVSIDTRILSATHKNLEEEVEKGHFRQDLYYRLNVIKLDVPSLEERGNDILLLAEHFLNLIAERWQLPKAALSNESIKVLSNYPFPGNVRELENILERACTLSDGEFIEPEDLQLSSIATDVRSVVKNEPILERSLEKPDFSSGNEKEQILHALNQTRWNRTAAAKTLGMTFRQLRYRIKKYDLDQLP
ncbi:two-component system response regulator PilR [Cocleimonas flava]|uniref:Two-component response regulator PilR n=1 Tax=Cocleimonas flava TaxID=634765 RepID=A0A4R1F4H7_9GAMM|nr:MULTISPECIES: sigma-54 dependent transcriptional regulator [Cocleimonas]MEB8431507.1 sigma-54 dependent transcriptional regulator [Cocleimonas sp. KMM 6892]MEC4713721.1 sigma-54 dependent transcriptional regulator [Cocleimonas sp. KMM 6895]MEC4743052.1 sigma-54 dependent transcriptional regulator [Cocleimonas sp. KMM 6896]TCJ89187.1 two-component response regulator PilR [Cocleimonas flava]